SDWIDRLAVYLQLKVQMRPCRAAGAAHEADELTPYYLLAKPDAGGESHQVTVDGREFLPVLDANPIPIPTVGLGADNHPVARGINRGAGLRHEIDAIGHEQGALTRRRWVQAGKAGGSKRLSKPRRELEESVIAAPAGHRQSGR